MLLLLLLLGNLRLHLICSFREGLRLRAPTVSVLLVANTKGRRPAQLLRGPTAQPSAVDEGYETRWELEKGGSVATHPHRPHPPGSWQVMTFQHVPVDLAMACPTPPVRPPLPSSSKVTQEVTFEASCLWLATRSDAPPVTGATPTSSEAAEGWGAGGSEGGRSRWASVHLPHRSPYYG